MKAPLLALALVAVLQLATALEGGISFDESDGPLGGC
jgi:hypothetical protein